MPVRHPGGLYLASAWISLRRYFQPATGQPLPSMTVILYDSKTRTLKASRTCHSSTSRPTLTRPRRIAAPRSRTHTRSYPAIHLYFNGQMIRTRSDEIDYLLSLCFVQLMSRSFCSVIRTNMSPVHSCLHDALRWLLKGVSLSRGQRIPTYCSLECFIFLRLSNDANSMRFGTGPQLTERFSTHVHMHLVQVGPIVPSSSSFVSSATHSTSAYCSVLVRYDVYYYPTA